jgi:hypothetical protein
MVHSGQTMGPLIDPSHRLDYPSPKERGGLCMVGGIYSEQRCPICGARFRDNFKTALICPNHPDQQASQFRVYFKGVTKRFSSYLESSRHLTGLRFETDNGKFDPREYRKSKPLGFENLSHQWLKIKEKEVKKSSYRKIADHLHKASKFWGNISIKEIGFKEIQFFLLSLENISDKTKHNHLSSVRQFFGWLKKAKVIESIPDFPEIRFELAWRKTVDKETQLAIIGEVYRISYRINPKIWIGIKFLSTYFNLRPGELLNIKEGTLISGKERSSFPIRRRSARRRFFSCPKM